MGVIGKVGAGKSSLLAAIMGEMRKKTGLVGVKVLALFQTYALYLCRFVWLTYPVGLHMLVRSLGYSTLL